MLHRRVASPTGLLASPTKSQYKGTMPCLLLAGMFVFTTACVALLVMMGTAMQQQTSPRLISATSQSGVKRASPGSVGSIAQGGDALRLTLQPYSEDMETDGGSHNWTSAGIEVETTLASAASRDAAKSQEHLPQKLIAETTNISTRSLEPGARPSVTAQDDAGDKPAAHPVPRIAQEAVPKSTSAGSKAPEAGAPGSLAHLADFRSRTAPEFDTMDKAAYKYDAAAFHSYGKTKPFIASVMDMEALEAGFAGRSFNNELIVFNGDDSPNMLEMVISSVLKFKTLGFGHWIMVTEWKRSCDNAQAAYPDLACVYGGPFWNETFITDTPNAYHSDRIARLWMYRWLVFSKAVQFGYNVLVTDLDVYWADSVYKYVKHPNIRQFNLITPHEMMVPGINCGLVYAQDTWRDGPTAWIASQVTDRTLRWREYPNFKNPQMPRYVIRLFEQDIFNDATCSAIVGRPVNTRVHRYKNAEKWWQLHMKYCDNTGKKAQMVFPDEYTAVDPAAPDASGKALRKTTIVYHDLVLPNTDGVWIDQFGRPPFPGVRRAASVGFMDFMRAGGVPMWVEPEEADDVENKRLTRKEKFVASPHWLFDIYPAQGMLGYWGRHPPRVVGGHLIELGGHQQHSKRFLLKMLKWWDYEASKMVKGAGMWVGSTPQAPLPKLLMFLPNHGVLAATRADMKLMVQNSLFLMYLMLKKSRVVVWPQTHCSSKWVYKTDRSVHGIGEYKLYAHGQGPDDRQCYDIGYMNSFCASIGMYWPDYEQYIKTLDTPAETAPSRENTLFWEDAPGPREISQARSVSVPYDELRSSLESMAALRVVHVAKFPNITGIPQAITSALTSLTSGCEFFMLNPVWPHTRRLAQLAAL